MPRCALKTPGHAFLLFFHIPPAATMRSIIMSRPCIVIFTSPPTDSACHVWHAHIAGHQSLINTIERAACALEDRCCVYVCTLLKRFVRTYRSMRECEKDGKNDTLEWRAPRLMHARRGPWSSAAAAHISSRSSHSMIVALHSRLVMRLIYNSFDECEVPRFAAAVDENSCDASLHKLGTDGRRNEFANV